jgi:protein SCO1
MFSLWSCLLLGMPVTQTPEPRLAVIREAPAFTLTNQDGKTVKLSDFKGKVVLVSFIFTTCNGSCPATTHRLAKVREWLRGDANFRPAVEFVSITLDPVRDTPAALKKYIQLYDLQMDKEIKWLGWTFLTGAREAVHKTIADWGMWVKPAANGQLDHPSRIFLLDRQGRIREIYNVNLLRTFDVVGDIGELWEEKIGR